jgi:hypothetical protein
VKRKQEYTNDLNAPRMKKGKFSKHVVTKELWKAFRDKSTEYKDISWEEFYEAWEEIAKTIRDETVHNPLGVKLGSYAGELKLQYLPYKFEAINPAMGNKHLNLTTRGKVAKVKWERRWAVKFNRVLQFFGFEGHREIKSMGNKHILKNTDSLRVSRSTLGGHSVWRNLTKKPK